MTLKVSPASHLTILAKVKFCTASSHQRDIFIPDNIFHIYSHRSALNSIFSRSKYNILYITTTKNALFLFISVVQNLPLWIHNALHSAAKNLQYVLQMSLSGLSIASLFLPVTENICHAKYGRRVVTYYALSHGHTLQHELSYCDNRCLERHSSLGPWTNWGWLLKPDKTIVWDFRGSNKGTCYIMFLVKG